MEKILNLKNHQDRWDGSNWTSQDLIDFEDDIIKHWENGEITGPIPVSYTHLTLPTIYSV